MHETSKRIIIVLIVVLLGVIFYETSILIKGISEANKFHNNQMNILSESTLKLDIEYGKYIALYNETFNEKDKNSYLEIYENGTYKFSVNLCEGIYEYKGFFNISEEVLNLKNVNNDCYGFTNCDKSEFKFEIKDNKTLILNDEIGCLGKNSKLVLE